MEAKIVGDITAKWCLQAKKHHGWVAAPKAKGNTWDSFSPEPSERARPCSTLTLDF